MGNRQKHDKMPLLECFKLNYRGYQIWKQREAELFLCLFVSAVTSGIIPYVTIYFSAQIVSELSGTRNPSRLLYLIILTLAITTSLAILNAILKRWKNSRQAGTYYKRQKIYADKLQDMDFCDIDRQYTHKLLSQIDQNEKWSGWGMGRIFSYFETVLKSIVSIITAFALTLSLFTSQVPETAGKMIVINNPLFSMLVILTFIVVTILTPACRNQGKKYWFRNTESSNQGNRIFNFFSYMGQEHYRAMDIRIYQQQNIGDYYLDKEKSFSADSQIARYARGPMGLWNVAGAVISTVFTGIIYLFVCMKSWAGAFGIGAVTQYIGAISTLSQGVAKLVETAGDMRSNAVFLKTTFEFLDIPNQMCQGNKEASVQHSMEIEFCDVSFQYPDSETYALRHVSMKIKEGECIAVVGMNGSGKSTFTKLLCRLYDPTEGKILLNGIDIRQYDYESYRALFSVVFQDFKLLSFSLGENVAAKAVYDEELVEECLTKAGFEQKLNKLPKSTETSLSKEFDMEGVEMSGGEAQKIAIARALYRNAPIMILDEPTSALDPVVEMEIYRKFDEITRDKSVIYISHRLSSCRFCDEILVFHEGKLIQRGSHDMLIRNTCGKYYELWQAQAQYYV